MTSPSAASLAAISARPPSSKAVGRLAAPLGLAGQHAEDVLVGELARLLAGDLRVGDGGQHHPQRRGAQLVTRLDGGGEVGAETVLQSTHGPIVAALPDALLPPRSCRAAAVGAVAGAGLTTYAAWEARQYTLRRVTVPLLPAGHAPLKVLHLSDIHMAPDQRAKQEWLRGLAALEPDLVVNTGDNLAHRARCPVVADALGGLLDVPGVYVLGSNDYWVPGCATRSSTCCPTPASAHTTAASCRGPSSRTASTRAGWLDLTNGFGSLTVGGTSIAFAGVDDPHLKYDDLARVAGPADPAADVRLGVTHAPYLRVLDQFAADGYDAIIAGHTHGGQVCLPGGRAR